MKREYRLDFWRVHPYGQNALEGYYRNLSDGRDMVWSSTPTLKLPLTEVELEDGDVIYDTMNTKYTLGPTYLEGVNNGLCPPR